MANPAGFPIWYELLSTNSDASKKFYEDVLGWNVQAPMPGGPHDYRMIDTKSAHVGGLMQLTNEMQKNGARPAWLVYLAVQDVDATAKHAAELGGTILMQPFDIPEAGRAAMIADPAGTPFYIMRGSSEGTSTVFERTGMGKCNWNELTTAEQSRVDEFFAKLLGWTYPDKMAMPGGAEYIFVDVGGTRIGATAPQSQEMPQGWTFYFRAPNIDEAVEKVKRGGGKVHAGPMDVPGGDRVIVATDPHGARFGVAAPAK